MRGAALVVGIYLVVRFWDGLGKRGGQENRRKGGKAKREEVVQRTFFSAFTVAPQTHFGNLSAGKLHL